MTKVTCADCLAVGLCIGGQRRFLSRHGFDFRDFYDNGIDIARFDGIEDFNLSRAIEQAKKREADDGRRQGQQD